MSHSCSNLCNKEEGEKLLIPRLFWGFECNYSYVYAHTALSLYGSNPATGVETFPPVSPVFWGLNHRVIILNRGSMPRKRTGRKWWNFSRPECATSQRDVTRDCPLIGLWPFLWVGGWGKSMYSAFPGNCSVSYLSFVYGRSLWAELNGGENSVHWKANMPPPPI